jgi:TonB family protein
MRPRALFVAAALVAASVTGAPFAWAQRPAAPAHKLEPPKLQSFIEADFPEAEKASGKGAIVVLQIAIGADGKVTQVAVLQSASPAFDAAALDAAKKFVFDPARADGKPIPVRIQYRYEFVWKDEYVQKKTADFAGVVRDGAAKKPLVNATVKLDSGETTTTDAEGKFSILDVAPGDHEVTITAAGFPSIVTRETLEAGKKLDATYEIQPEKPKKKGGKEDDEDEEIVVTAPRIVKQTVSTEVKSEQARRVPGTQGDVLKVVENLPGVARSAVGSGALVVWGASPQDTRVYIEGIRIPQLYHDGGYRSVIHSDMVKSVDLVPGGYGSPYGRGLGGLIQVQLRPLDEPGIHGSASADILDSAASLRAQLGDDWHFAVAARKSYLDSVVGAVTSKDVAAFVPLPKYYDGQVRLAYTLGPRETLEVGGLLSSDSTNHSVASDDPSLQKIENRSLSFWRVYARYDRRLADGTVITVTPSVGRDHARLFDQFGTVPSELDSDSTFVGFRASWRGQVESWLALQVGLDAEAVISDLHRSGSIAAPPREGDIRVFGQIPSDQVNVDDWKATIGSFAPFAEGDISLFDDKVHIVPGARFEPFMILGSRQTPLAGDTPQIGYESEHTIIEPRIAIRYALSDRMLVKAAYGQYHQAPAAEDLSAVFGTPSLGLSQAQHFVGGTAYKLTHSLSVELTGFLTQSQDLAVRSVNPSPPLAEALEQDGRGRSYGTQLLLRQEQISRFFGWVSYTLSRAERSDYAHALFRLFDYDQTHVFTALGAYDLGHGFEVGVRARVASGFPRTPVIGAYFDTRADLYEPIFGAHNAIRIPAFFSTDVRLAKRFTFSWGKAEVYLDVQNVTNHTNPEQIIYNATYSSHGYITGLPVLPVLGARIEW